MKCFVTIWWHHYLISMSLLFVCLFVSAGFQLRRALLAKWQGQGKSWTFQMLTQTRVLTGERGVWSLSFLPWGSLAEPSLMGSVVSACYQWSEHGLRLLIQQCSLLGPDRAKWQSCRFSWWPCHNFIPLCTVSVCTHLPHGNKDWVLDHPVWFVELGPVLYPL